ncbi:hypothetical protein Tco_0575786 [Tanacetum coccineum]
MVVHNQEETGKGSAMLTDPHHTPTIIQPSISQPQKTQKPRRSKRKDNEVPHPSGPTTNVVDEAVNKEMDDSLVRAATTASSLEAEQDSVLDLETTKTTQANEIASLKRRVKKLENKNKSRTHKLKRLYKVGLSARVESSEDEESLGKDASKQGRRITDIDDDEDITMVNDQIDADTEMFDVDNLMTVIEEKAEQVVAAKYVNLSVDEVTLAQALVALKSEKVQEKGDVIKEPSVPVSIVTTSTKDSVATTTTAIIPTPRKGIVFEESGITTTTTTIFSQQPSHASVQDKGKEKMVEPEKPMKKELIRLDEEIASKLQAEFDEEVRLAREKAEKEQEANVALTEEWDDIQAKIEADHELAQRLQAQEQEELSNVEKAILFVQLLEKRRNHFVVKRAEEKRNKPPTQLNIIVLILILLYLFYVQCYC